MKTGKYLFLLLLGLFLNETGNCAAFAQTRWTVEKAGATRDLIGELTKLRRPLICTEWMARDNGCTIESCLPIYKETRVGCIMWGLVNGKSQVHLPFGYRGDNLPTKAPGNTTSSATT